MVGTSMQLLLIVAFIASSCDASLWGSLKQDCGVSIWSLWSPHQDGVTRTRTRTIWREPQNGGAKCPVLSETETNVWNPRRTAAQIATALEISFLSSRSVTDVTNGRRRRDTTILPRDLLFIVDMSGSIRRAPFEQAKRDIAKLIEKICGDVGQGRDQNRVAVISFSSNAVINFRLADHMTLQQVQAAIMSIPYEGRATCLHKALQDAVDVFRLDTGSRSDTFSVKEVVILTDGGWNCADDATIYNLAGQLSASSNGRPITRYAFVIGTFSSTASQSRFDQLVTVPVQSHLFVFPQKQIFTEVVNIILSYGGSNTVCAPITIKK